VEIIGSSKSLQAALGRSSASLTGFSAKADRVGRGLTTTGRTLTRNMTLPIVAAGAAATKMALDFDTAMNHVQALTGASAAQTKRWGDQILALAPKIGQSPQQLAEALYFVASSGAKVNQVLPITAASARAAASGMGDAQTVAQLLTSAINAYGPSALSAKKATDILTESIKVGKAEPQDFAQNLGKVIPVAQNMGVSFAEVSALTANLTNTGLDAATATTGLRNAMLKLLAPTAASTKELQKIGLSVADVQNEVKTKGLLSTLQDLSNRVHGNRQAMHALFPDARGLTAILALIGPNAGKASAALDKVEHSTGAADKAFRTAQKGPAFKLNQDMAQLRVSAIKLGNDLVPALTRGADAVGNLADAFAGLTPKEQNAILILAGSAAALGPVFSILGNISLGFSKVGQAAEGSAKFMQSATGAERVFGLNAKGTAVGLAQLGIYGGLAAGAIGLIYLATQNATTGLNAMQRAEKNAEGAVDGLTGALNRSKSATQTATDDQHLAALALTQAKDAQHAVTQAVNQYGAKSRQARDATAAAKVSWDQYRHASEQAKSSTSAATKAQEAQRKKLGQVRNAVERYAQSTREQINADRKAQNIHAGLSNRVDEHRQALQHLIGSITSEIGKIQGSFPAQAANLSKIRAQAEAALILGNRIRGIPSQKRIDIYLIEHQQQVIVGNQRIGAPTAVTQGGATPSGHPAIGGPVIAGKRYMVGERGPEEFVPQSSGRIIPNGRGGRVALTITNWRDGTGYIEEVAGGVTRGADRRRGQLQRMGA
jgi:TP901 family phage tail tape measure protein